MRFLPQGGLARAAFGPYKAAWTALGPGPQNHAPGSARSAICTAGPMFSGPQEDLVRGVFGPQGGFARADLGPEKAVNSARPDVRFARQGRCFQVHQGLKNTPPDTICTAGPMFSGPHECLVRSVFGPQGDLARADWGPRRRSNILGQTCDLYGRADVFRAPGDLVRGDFVPQGGLARADVVPKRRSRKDATRAICTAGPIAAQGLKSTLPG